MEEIEIWIYFWTGSCFLFLILWMIINFKTKDRFGYCKREIEEGVKCKKQCDHCKTYFKPLEDNLKKIKK